MISNTGTTSVFDLHHNNNKWPQTHLGLALVYSIQRTIATVFIETTVILSILMFLIQI